MSLNSFEKLVEQTMDRGWNWNELSSNPNITPAFVEKYPNKRWLYGDEQVARITPDEDLGLSANPNITLDFIEKHFDKPWNWSYLVEKRKIITTNFILKHLGDVDWFNRRYNWIKLSSTTNLILDISIEEIRKIFKNILNENIVNIICDYYE